MSKARKPSTPAAPAHLAAATREWWKQIASDFVLESHHLRLLTRAAEAWDRGEQARKVLDKQGLTYMDRFEQPRARPEVGIERDSGIAFARLLRELCLDVEPPADNRPPRRGGVGD
jgi:phage terminase small subunit